MFPMTIRIKKKTDGSAALICERRDGSVTWQRQEGKLAAFFPTHDLTHYAVESVLRHRRGFYGLVAAGWNITDFGARPLPADMDPSENIVGFLDAERAGGERWTAAQLAEYFRRAGLAPPSVSDDQLNRIREVRSALLEQWRELEPGRTLEIAFDPGAPAAQAPISPRAADEGRLT